MIVRRLPALGRRREPRGQARRRIRFTSSSRSRETGGAGMAPDEAQRQAPDPFGGVEQIRERTRDKFVRPSRARRTQHSLACARSAAASAMAVLSLRDGVGAMRSLRRDHTMLLRSSPLGEPETLVNIYENRTRTGGSADVAPEHRGPTQGDRQTLQRHRAVQLRPSPQSIREGTAAMVMGEG